MDSCFDTLVFLRIHKITTSLVLALLMPLITGLYLQDLLAPSTSPVSKKAMTVTVDLTRPASLQSRQHWHEMPPHLLTATGAPPKQLEALTCLPLW